MKTSVKLLIATISLEFILSLVAIIVLSNQVKNNLAFETGKMVDQIHEIQPFKQIVINGNIAVHWEKGDSLFVKMQIDETLVKEVTITSDSDCLKIEAPKVFHKKKMIMVINSPDFNKITLNNGALFFFDDTLNVEKMSVFADNGSELKLKLKGQSAEFNINDGSTLNVVGILQNVLIKAYNGSDVKVEHLEVLNGKFDATDGSSVSLMVKDTLVIKAVNGCNVNIYGSPKIKQIEADVSSSVKQLS